MKILVLGGGIQGSAIVRALKTLEPSIRIAVVDNDDDKLRAVPAAEQAFLGTVPEGIPGKDQWDGDCVISALPYYLNEKAARFCAHQKWRWLDLGGNFQSSEKIRNIYEGLAPCCTDLGLAPGLVGVLGWWLMSGPLSKKIRTPKSVELFCGGLPLPIPPNRFKYSLSWSAEGLINEYFNFCHALIDGEIAEIAPLAVNESVQWETETLEAFATSGGVDPSFFEELMDNGVDNAYYRTLRYAGHAEEIKYLLSCGLTTSQIRDAIASNPPPTNDRVAIEIRYKYRTGMVSYQFDIPRRHGLTAMQRGTAYPAAVAAYMLAQGDFDNHERITSRTFATDDFFESLFAMQLWNCKNREGWVRRTETSW